MKLRDRGYVEIQLDKTRHLKIDFTAARKYEELTGKSMSRLQQEEAGISTMNYFFWAALAHEKIENWTLETAEQLMLEAESVEYVFTKVAEALNLFFGDGKKN